MSNDDSKLLDASSKATEHLNELIDAGEVTDDIVILDERIQEREASKVSTEPVSPEATEEYSEPSEEQSGVTVAEARFGSSVLETASERDSVRLLIFTKNSSILEVGSLAQKRILELGGLFAELHVIVLKEYTEETPSTVRLADNVWLYSTESSYWWKMGFDAYHMAREQLVFAGGFRADMIIAEDPFESGLAAYLVAKKYERSYQIHLLEDIYDPGFKEQDPNNMWRLFVSKYITLKKASCVRTNSEGLRAQVLAEHPRLGEERVETLPMYYDLEAWRDTTPSFDLKTRYPQFKFIILHISTMHARSHTSEVIQGAMPLLRMYPTIGLVIVGNGPLRASIEKQVIGLGIAHKVEFEPTPSELISHMKSAHVLVHISEDPEEDTVVLEAATVKLPIIGSKANIAGTLFTHGESAFLCESADPATVSQYLKMFLNDNLARTRLGMDAQEIVFERIEQDYAAYLNAYRSSIERCV